MVEWREHGPRNTRSTLLRSSFPAFVCLQGALYAAYGIESPLLP